MKKADNPTAYWAEQAEVLAVKNPVLYNQVREHQLRRWDGGSIDFAHKLGKRLAAALGNPHDYAVSTFTSAIKDAIIKRERAVRRSSAGV